MNVWLRSYHFFRPKLRVLSKRWDCLWMWLVKLEYDDNQYSVSERKKLKRFLHRNLQLHKAPVIESLRLKLSDSYFKPRDIYPWVLVAASRCVHELEISYSYHPEKQSLILPSSLYNSKSLVILKLDGRILLGDIPRNVCLPSLKTLQLLYVSSLDANSLQRLLSICPFLEDLMVEFDRTYWIEKFTISVPSLIRLTLGVPYSSHGIDINTPSLEYFKLEDENEDEERHDYMFENMPKLVEAYLDCFSYVDTLTGVIASVKRLSFCLHNSDFEVVYGDGVIFNKLEHLKLCLCKCLSTNVLIRMLENCPNLRTLELFIMECHSDYGHITCQEELTMAPKCLLSSLQVFNWSWYHGKPEEKDFAVYILKNAPCLKTVRISSKEDEVPKLEMLMELALSSRASTTCKLIFK